MAPPRGTIDICLQFTKFSHALGVRPNGTIAWSHVTSDNLFVLVKGSEPDAGSGQLLMRIINNNQVLACDCFQLLNLHTVADSDAGEHRHWRSYRRRQQDPTHTRASGNKTES